MNRKLPLVVSGPMMPTYWQIASAETLMEVFSHVVRFQKEMIAYRAYCVTVQLNKVNN